MIVDPGRSGNKPGQETNHSTQAAGNRPNLQEARPVSVHSHKMSWQCVSTCNAQLEELLKAFAITVLLITQWRVRLNGHCVEF